VRKVRGEGMEGRWGRAIIKEQERCDGSWR
jgi:hypothetical protein